MASVDPYMPCPCGSGQKFKWCCQKVESYAERAQRMVDSGQIEASLKPLEEGLARFPDNAWLLTRKAVVEAHLKRFEPAKASLRSLLKKNPGHVGGTILLTRLLLETEGPDASIAQFQQGLSAMPADCRRDLAPLAQFLGVSLQPGGTADRLVEAPGSRRPVGRRPGQGPDDRPLDRHPAADPADLRLGEESVSAHGRCRRG